MAELATLARPYAEAIFKRSQEQSNAAEWTDTLSFLATMMEDEDLIYAASNPRVEHSRFEALLLDICAGQVIDEGVNLVRLLIQNQRLNLLAKIKEQFESYRAEAEGYIDVELLSAYAMTKADQKTFATTLEKSLKRNVRLHLERDTSLIGGVIIRAGDQVIDGSVRGQLEQLAKSLS